ncbi:hypothetical protein ACFQ3Z_12610 [Streptomyces nogalater]
MPRPGAVLAAVTALVATLGLGLAGEAKAAAGRAATPAKTVGPFDDDRPHGFASLAGGTTGGRRPGRHRHRPGVPRPPLTRRRLHTAPTPCPRTIQQKRADQ